MSIRNIVFFIDLLFIICIIGLIRTGSIYALYGIMFLIAALLMYSYYVGLKVNEIFSVNVNQVKVLGIIMLSYIGVHFSDDKMADMDIFDVGNMENMSDFPMDTEMLKPLIMWLCDEITLTEYMNELEAIYKEMDDEEGSSNKGE